MGSVQAPWTVVERNLGILPLICGFLFLLRNYVGWQGTLARPAASLGTTE
jgi:hypothetical protein